jgi:hypothetical protein
MDKDNEDIKELFGLDSMKSSLIMCELFSFMKGDNGKYVDEIEFYKKSLEYCNTLKDNEKSFAIMILGKYNGTATSFDSIIDILNKKKDSQLREAIKKEIDESSKIFILSAVIGKKIRDL